MSPEEAREMIEEQSLIIRDLKLYIWELEAEVRRLNSRGYS